MGKKLTVKKRVIVDEGIYAAKVKSIEKKDGKFGDYYQVSFKITEEEFEGKTVNGNMPAEIEVGNKTYKWASILLGRELEVDEELDPDDLVGKSCKVAVEHNSNDEGTFAKVTALYKKKKKGDDDEEDEDEEDNKKKKSKKDDDDEEEDNSKKKKKKDDDEDEDEDEDEEDEDDEDDKKKKKKDKDDDEDEDEDDEDEDDEDDKKKKKKDDDEDDEEFK